MAVVPDDVRPKRVLAATLRAVPVEPTQLLVGVEADAGPLVPPGVRWLTRHPAAAASRLHSFPSLGGGFSAFTARTKQVARIA